MIVIADYGLGNLGSIQNMFKKIGADAVVSSERGTLEAADKIILPGVGKFDAGMTGLRERDLLEVLNRKVMDDKIPVLGICLGMQLLTNGSDEGRLPGLGWIDGYAHHFDLDEGYKIPHMGWNKVKITNKNELTEGMDETDKFYFVHSYYVRTKDKADMFLATEYGIEFASGIFHGNIFGVQFHPEKSHRYGMKLLKKFAEL